MKAQTSFEFLIYVAVSAASLAVMLKLYLLGSASISAFRDGASMQQLAGQIALLFGQQGGSFYVYLPDDPCNITTEGASMLYRNQSYALPGNVSLNRTKICGLGGIVELHSELLQNGTLEVG